MRMSRIVIYCLSGSKIFFHIISQSNNFQKKKKLLNTQKVRFDFLCTFCLKHLSFQEEVGEILLKSAF